MPLLFQEDTLCPHCGAEADGHFGLCRGCEKEMEYVGSRIVLEDGSDFFFCHTALFYNNFLRHLVVSYKKEQQTWFGPIFSKILAEYAVQHPVLSQLHWVSYVPQSRRKGILRAAHPSREMAEAVGNALHIPVFPLLKKQGWRPPQKSLGRMERMRNVRGAFSMRPDWEKRKEHSPAFRDDSCVWQKPGMMVDDLLTTGATMKEVLRVLHREGIVAVGLCLASVKEPSPTEREGIWYSGS